MIKDYQIDTDTCTEPEEQLRFLMMEDAVFVNNGWWYEKEGKPWPKDVTPMKNGILGCGVK